MRSHLVLESTNSEIYYKMMERKSKMIAIPRELIGLKDGLVAAFDRLMKTEERNEFVQFNGDEFRQLAKSVETSQSTNLSVIEHSSFQQL